MKARKDERSGASKAGRFDHFYTRDPSDNAHGPHSQTRPPAGLGIMPRAGVIANGHPLPRGSGMCR